MPLGWDLGICENDSVDDGISNKAIDAIFVQSFEKSVLFDFTFSINPSILEMV